MENVYARFLKNKNSTLLCTAPQDDPLKLQSPHEMKLALHSTFKLLHIRRVAERKQSWVNIIETINVASPEWTGVEGCSTASYKMMNSVIGDKPRHWISGS